MLPSSHWKAHPQSLHIKSLCKRGWYFLGLLLIGIVVSLPSSCFVATSGQRQERSSRLVALRATEDGGKPAKERKVVAVLGAGGRTGSLVPGELLKLGVTPLALTRSGKWTPPEGTTADGIEVGTADVTSPETLVAALAGVSAVVWAAAFSRNKSTPQEVDYAGLVNTARAVREQNVERLVVVSSAATTRPYAPVGALLNTIASGVLLEKLKGESQMKGILEGTQASYTIIKPGGLRMGKAKGFASLEFNQGDTHVGGVQRADVAAVAAACAVDPNNPAANKTFEMYEAESRSGLLPWFGEPKYKVDGSSDCGDMLSKLLVDKDVPEVSPWPF